MTRLIVSLEDTSMLSEIKNAIGLLKGVASVIVSKTSDIPNETTIKAIEDLENGNSIVCDSFADYQKLVRDELPD